MILVDSRTGSVEISTLLSTSNIVCHLNYADFTWCGNGPDGGINIGVERKSIMDLLQSMTTGRLSGHQLIGLTENYDLVYLLVEGVWRPDRNTGILQRISNGGKWVAAAQGSRRFMARDVYNFINTIQVMCGVVTVCTSNQWETAKWLDSIYGWWQKKWDKHKSHLQWQKPVVHAHLSKPNLVTKVASQFDGIGWDKARSIGFQFDLLEDFLGATEKELCEVPGVGPKLARSIILQRNGG